MLFNLLLIYKEYAGNLVDGRSLPLPLGYGACHRILIVAGEIGSDAEACLWAARAEDVVKHLQVAVGGLNEAVTVYAGIGSKRTDKTDVLTFRGLDRTHSAVVGVVYVSNLEGCTVTGKTSGTQR